MAKTKGHSPSLFKITQTNIQYNPKMEIVSQRIGKGILKFDKMPKREINFEKPQYVKNMIDQESIQRGYMLIDKKDNTALFGHSKVFLEKNNPFGLPKFLVVWIHKTIGPKQSYGSKHNEYQKYEIKQLCKL